MHARVLAHREGILARMARIVDHGKFILGPEVEELETALSRWVGTSLESPASSTLAPAPPSPTEWIHTVTCASGTDALRLALMALDIGPGHAVVIPAFGFAAAAEAVLLAGATPLFADIDPSTFNLDPADVSRRLLDFRQTQSGSGGKISPRAIIAIDTFGLPADYRALRKVADFHGLFLIEDAAQSMGSAYFGKRAGSLADIATTSFYPTKTLGCLGDGGAVFTADANLAARLRRLRDHGQAGKYWHVEVGMNSRLDSLQAAVLLEMLPGLEEELKSRRSIVEGYARSLRGVEDVLQLPREPRGYSSAWSFFTILTEYRDELKNGMQEKGLPYFCHYPRLLPESPAFELFWPQNRRGLFYPGLAVERNYPIAYKTSRQCLSLPLHGGMTESDLDTVAACLSELSAVKQVDEIPN